MVFYSGHDSTIAILLAALNFTSIDCISQKYLTNITTEHCYWQYPPFASSFVFELWEEDNKTKHIEVGTLSIQISINGKRYPIPICNYAYSCPLETF